MFILLIILIGIIFITSQLIDIVLECTDCTKNNKYKWHSWEYHDDLYIPHPDSSYGKFVISLQGHNLCSKNKRYICKKCGKIEYLN